MPVDRESDETFSVEKKGKKKDDMISLTETGKKLAKCFNDNVNELEPVEIAIMRGLQPTGSGFYFLGLLEDAKPNGLLREELEEKMKEKYGDNGEIRTGYLTTWYSRLGVIQKEQEGRKKRYKLAVPTSIQWRED